MIGGDRDRRVVSAETPDEDVEPFAATLPDDVVIAAVFGERQRK